MAAIDFPSNPSLNQIYTHSNGFAYKWDGTVWQNYYAPGAFGGELRADLRDDTSPELGNHLDARNLNIDNVGIITANEFHGSGANLTNLPPSGFIVNERSSTDVATNAQSGTYELSFLNTQFNVVPLGGGRARVESAGGGFASIGNVSSATYASVNFIGAGVTISTATNNVTFTATLAGLTDTQNISSATDGQVLKYSSSIGKWIPGDDLDGTAGELGPDDYAEAAGYAYSSGYWSPTTNGATTKVAAYSNLTGTSQLSAWIDGLNDILGKLVPPAPPALSGVVGISTASDSVDGRYGLCAEGNGHTIVKNWVGTDPPAGYSYAVRFPSSTGKIKLETDSGSDQYQEATGENPVVTKIGPGNSGHLYVRHNNENAPYSGIVTFTSSDNSGSYGMNGEITTTANGIIRISNNVDASTYYNDSTDPTRSVNGRAINAEFYDIYDVEFQFGNITSIPSGMNMVAVHHKTTDNQTGIGTLSSSSSFSSTRRAKTYWYEADAGPGNPSLTFGSVNNPTGFVATKSSGVSHVPANQAFSYTVSATNLTGQLYLKENAYGTLGSHPVGISTGIITEENTIRYQDFDSASTPIGNLGVSSPISYVFSNDVNANTFAKATAATAFGTHTIKSPYAPNGVTHNLSGSTTYLLYSGTQTNVPDELNSTIDALVGTNFKRCAAGANSNTPTMNTTGGAWNPNNIISDSYEAKIIGGAITADKNNYSSGFFPTSTADYSAHNNTQYCQFEFTSVSAGIQGFDLLITGTFTGLWVAMPNNLGDGPTGWMQGDAGWNGWADCSQTLAYGRPGTGGTGAALVGGESDGNHSAIDVTTGAINSSEVIHVNFGTSSTVWSTGNKTVFIRFSLAQGQSITRLAVKPYLST